MILESMLSQLTDLRPQTSKTMLVGKQHSSCHVPNLGVDTWKTEHDEEGKLVETFEGKKPLENTNELCYLGVKLSADGTNNN